MSTQRNATSTAKFCSGWQIHTTVPLAAMALAEPIVRLPSLRPIDHRWDRSRGLMTSSRRRDTRHDLSWIQPDGTDLGYPSFSRRTYASRPPPGRRLPVARELNQFMESMEDSQGGLGDRNAIAKTIAERNQALKERDLARKEEQQLRKGLAQLQVDTKRIVDTAKRDVTGLKTRSDTLNEQRLEAARDRDLARKTGQETRAALEKAEALVAQLTAQNATLMKELTEREKERNTQHDAAMENVNQQRVALGSAQQLVHDREQELEALEERFEIEKQRLFQKTAEDMDVFRSELRDEYEEKEFVKNIREKQKIVEETQSARSEVERENMANQAQSLRDALAEMKASHNDKIFQRLRELESDAAETQIANTRALQERRMVRATERSDYQAYSSLFADLMNVGVSATFWKVQAELSSRLGCWPRHPSYLISIKNRNPWFELRYPHLVNRLQNIGFSRRVQIESDLASARLLEEQLDAARREFLLNGHNSRESTRYFRLAPVRNNFDITMLHSSVAALQDVRDEAKRRTLKVKELERSSTTDAYDRRRDLEIRSMQRLRSVHQYALDAARAKAIKAMQEDTYSKKVAFRMLHEQKDKFNQILSRMPSCATTPGIDYDDLKRKAKEVGSAIAQIEGDVQKRAMLQQRLKPEIALQEEQNFKDWSSALYDEYMDVARDGLEAKARADQSSSRAVRLPLTQRQLPGTKSTRPKNAATPISKIRKIGKPATRIRLQLKKISKKLQAHQEDLMKRQNSKVVEDSTVSSESADFTTLNLKPSAATQARHASGLSHALVTHNNCDSWAIDTSFVDSPSTSRSINPHLGAYTSDVFAGNAGHDVSQSATFTHHFARELDMESPHPSATSVALSAYLSEENVGVEVVGSKSGETASNFSAIGPPTSVSDPDSLAGSELVENAAAEETSEEVQHDDAITSDTALTYQISARDYRDAAKASLNTNAAFWTYRLYKNANGARPTLHYCTKFDQAEEQAQKFVNETVLGFDLEWEVGSSDNSSIKNSVSLVQIASEDKIGLFQLAMFKGDSIEELMPPTLRSILESEKIVKAGVNIAGDASRMKRCFDIRMRGMMELSHLFKVVMLSEQQPHKVNRGLVSLAEQVSKVLRLPLKKDKVRTSAWSKRLNTTQTEYAGTDAYAGLRLFYALEQERKRMSPQPPQPAFYELEKPLVLGDGTVIKPYAKKPVGKKKLKNPAETGSLDDEFFDSLETQVSDDAGDGNVPPGAPFTAVDAVYPTLPLGNVDLSTLHILENEPPPTDDEYLDGVHISQFDDDDDDEYSHKPAQQQTAPATSNESGTDTASARSKPLATARKPPPDTPEMALATTWTSTRLASLRDNQTAKTGPSTLRVYHLWHMQNLDVPRVAALARDPPLMQNTVATYIMTALTQERLPFDKQRAQEVLGYLPRTTAGRFERFLSRWESL
nr:werner syndrome atp-dependent helicase [Quercus suber]